MSLMQAFAPNPTGPSSVFHFRETPMMRQESPSPNSSLSSSALAAAKPPTPTSSPKLRRRTVSGSSDQSIVRQNLDIGAEDEEVREDVSRPPTQQPVVQDKRRSSGCPSDPPSPARASANRSGRVNSNKCVKRTQSLKEQLVSFFTQKNSTNSSSSSPSASPTSAVDKMETPKAAVMPHGHAPVIRTTRRGNSSRIPQYTGVSAVIGGVQGISLSNGTGPSNAGPGREEDGEAHASLYSARQFADEMRSSDEHGSISYDVHSSGHQLRVVKDPEASPFRSHTVDRCGVVVPSAPSSASSKLPHDPSELRQGSPSAQEVSSAKKSAAPRVMDIERLNQAMNQDMSQRWTRGGSMRHVQVLPDKKVRRDKTNSNENIASAVADTAPEVAGASSPAFIPRPPISKRPSTDSDDNSAPESATAVAAASAAASSASLPPRRRNWPPKKSPQHPRSSPIGIEPTSSRGAASPNNDLNLLIAAKPEDSSDADSLTEDCTSATVVPGMGSDGSDTSPKGGSPNGVNGASAAPSSSSSSSLRPRSNSLEYLVAENHTIPQIRQPQRRVRHSRAADAAAVPTGSPPKSVSWNLVPDVVNYDKDVHESEGSSSSSSRRHHYNRHHRHKSEINFMAGRGPPFKMRHAASDERIYDARKGIANSTLIAVHESFLEQMTNILKQEMELLEEVKQEKKSMTVYREVMQKILILKAQTVKQMQDILEQYEG